METPGQQQQNQSNFYRRFNGASAEIVSSIHVLFNPHWLLIGKERRDICTAGYHLNYRHILFDNGLWPRYAVKVFSPIRQFVAANPDIIAAAARYRSCSFDLRTQSAA